MEHPEKSGSNGFKQTLALSNLCIGDAVFAENNTVEAKKIQIKKSNAFVLKANALLAIIYNKCIENE